MGQDAAVIEGVTVRAVEPFSYFPELASAIVGLRGGEAAADPHYCFHTRYQDYRPGVVVLKVRLAGAWASHGELAVRVHGHRPNTDLDISLVAGARLRLDGLDDAAPEIALRIVALPGVHYALYGYFSEPSDLRAAGLAIVAEEQAGDPAIVDEGDIPLSAFGRRSFDSPTRLVSDDAPSFLHPISQPCTRGQIEHADFSRSWQDVVMPGGDPLDRWRTIFPLQALEAYGFVHLGATGLLIGEAPSPVARALTERGCPVQALVSHLRSADEAEEGGPVGYRSAETGAAVELEGYFDFAVVLGTLNALSSIGEASAFIKAVLGHVLRRGLAVFVFDHAAQPGQVEARPPFLPQRRDIEQIALRVLGQGCEVARLCFAENGHGDAAAAAVAPFGLIVRR